MSKSIPPGVAAAIIIIVVILALFFGYRFITGGPNADVTQENLKHWQQLRQRPPAPSSSAAGQPGQPGATTSSGK